MHSCKFARGGWVGAFCTLWVCVSLGTFESLHSMYTVCIWRCERSRSCVKVFMREISFSFTLPSFLPSFLPYFIPSVLHSLLPSFLPSFLPSSPMQTALWRADSSSSFCCPVAAWHLIGSTPPQLPDTRNLCDV